MDQYNPQGEAAHSEPPAAPPSFFPAPARAGRSAWSGVILGLVYAVSLGLHVGMGFTFSYLPKERKQQTVAIQMEDTKQKKKEEAKKKKEEIAQKARQAARDRLERLRQLKKSIDEDDENEKEEEKKKNGKGNDDEDDEEGENDRTSQVQ